MPYTFGEYELVLVRSRGDLPPASIRGWDKTGTIYDIRLPDGQVLQASENDLEATGRYETPFQFFEVVEIHPVDLKTEPKVVDVANKRGIITGISSPAASGSNRWGFAVTVQSGECWYFEENELKSTNLVLSEERVYGYSEDVVTISIRYNSGRDEEPLIDSDAPPFSRGPTPLRIDLETL